MDGFQGFGTQDVWGGECPAEPRDIGAELLETVRERNYPKAYRRLRELESPLSGVQAGECLSAGLHCSTALFAAILEHCEPGEYAATEQWKIDSHASLYVGVKGTILTLAAAMNKTGHMRLLLGRGWDPNSASYASAQALENTTPDHLISCHKGSEQSDNGGLLKSFLMIGEAEYNTHEKTIREMLWMTDCCTPLAAAITCGSKEAVRLLLRCPGILKEESSAVCRAALETLRMGVKNQECLDLVFPLKGNPFDGEGLIRELVSRYALWLAAVAAACNLREFTLRLTGAPCPPEQLCAAAAALAETPIKNRGRKLLRLLDLYPELGAEQSIRNGLLKMYLTGEGGKTVSKALLRRWQDLCGEQRDISCVDPYKWGSISAAERKEVLSRLGEGGALCAAAESAWLNN